MRKILSVIVFVFIVGTINHVFSQSSLRNTTYKLEILGTSSLNDKSAFWLQNNQNGIISYQPNSVNFSAGIFKKADTSQRIFDYGFKLNTLYQQSKEAHFLLPEAYVNARLAMLELKIGISIEFFGNQDSILSSGGLLFSQNSLPMPAISAGIPQFTPLPFTRKMVEIKGGIRHGYFTDNVMVENLLLHHKFGYLRIGGNLPIRLQYGLHHVAQWGGNVLSQGQQPTGIKNFVNVFFAKSGGDDALRTDQINTLGNHIISQNLKVELNFSSVQIDAYWQNVSEDGPVRFMPKSMNVSDGLWGIAIKSNQLPVVKRVVYEYLNTTDQSGPYHDKDGIVYGGADSYFTHGVYQAGWTYFSRTIGTPFITSPVYTNTTNIRNNRVTAHHLGIGGEVEKMRFKLLLSFSKNYGTYFQRYNTAKKGNVFLLEINRLIPAFSNLEASLTLAADRGNMYGNNYGCMLKISKSGVFTK